MANIKQVTIDGVTYTIKDETARNSIVTYSISLNGYTLTLTGSDGSTSTVNLNFATITQDPNTGSLYIT